MDFGTNYADYSFGTLKIFGESQKNFCYSEFVNCDFNGTEFNLCDFRHATFVECTFDRVIFYKCSLFWSKFKNCTFVGTSFQDSNLNNIDLSKNLIKRCLFERNEYENSNFEGLNVENSSIRDLDNINFWQNCKLSGTNLPSYICDEKFEISIKDNGFLGFTTKDKFASHYIEAQDWKVGQYITETLNISSFKNDGIMFRPSTQTINFKRCKEVWKALLKFEDAFFTVPYGKIGFKCSRLILLQKIHPLN